MPSLNQIWHYQGVIERWVDGDTLDIMVDRGEKIYTKNRYRLFGLNTPEKTGLEKKKGIIAQTQCERFLPEKCAVVIKTYKRGKYGRYTIEIWGKGAWETGHSSFNHYLLSSGYAKPISESGHMAKARFPMEEAYPIPHEEARHYQLGVEL